MRLKHHLSIFMILLFPAFLLAGEGLHSVKDFGAVNDGRSLCTEGIQKAIDHCAAEGGGKVLFPPGSYLSGPLFLKSNISIEVLPGATIHFSDDIESCPVVEGRWEGIERRVYASLFTGHNLENVSITGRGTLDGQGERWWKAYEETKALRKKHGIKEREPDNPKGSPLKVPRPRMINLYNCKNVLISELRIIDSPAWTIHPVYCENVTIEKISIIQPYESPNTDGINPESCKNVRILNCFVDCGDDCITIKSGYNEDGRRVGIPCENIVISNCTFAHGRSAIGIGSEMSGGVKNVAISNCVINGTLRGLRIKTNRDRGGTVENYRADNILMSEVETAISINMYYGTKENRPVPVSEKTPYFRNIHISNITATDLINCVQITGLPEAPVEDFSLVNSNFQAENGLEASFVREFRISDVRINCKSGSPLSIQEAKDIEIDNFSSDSSLEDRSLMVLKSLQGAFIHSCQVSERTGVFIKSIQSKDIELSNNLLRSSKIMEE